VIEVLAAQLSQRATYLPKFLINLFLVFKLCFRLELVGCRGVMFAELRIPLLDNPAFLRTRKLVRLHFPMCSNIGSSTVKFKRNNHP
jgi:hypothetical protein